MSEWMYLLSLSWTPTGRTIITANSGSDDLIFPLKLSQQAWQSTEPPAVLLQALCRSCSATLGWTCVSCKSEMLQENDLCNAEQRSHHSHVLVGSCTSTCILHLPQKWANIFTSKQLHESRLLRESSYKLLIALIRLLTSSISWALPTQPPPWLLP